MSRDKSILLEVNNQGQAVVRGRRYAEADLVSARPLVLVWLFCLLG